MLEIPVPSVGPLNAPGTEPTALYGRTELVTDFSVGSSRTNV
jgi:hypothetical protein